MELIIDEIVKPEIKDFLLTQVGITNVDINYDEYYVKINISFNDQTNPNIIMKYIELFEDYKYSNLVEFNKKIIGSYKNYKYTIKNICCEHCYMNLIHDLFENEKINSVKSNYKSCNIHEDIELLIEYNDNYQEESLREFLNQNSIINKEDY